MPIRNLDTAAPSLQADDAEIARYATLLDCLGVGLLVYTADAGICLSNAQARAMFNDGPVSFADESGCTLGEEDQPAALVLRTGRAIESCRLGLIDAGAPHRWVDAAALPILADDGSIRCVLLTLSDLSEQQWLEARLEQLSIHEPLTDAFNRRHTQHLLDQECERSQRYGTPTTIALIDIDYYQEIKDTDGQATGERILGSVAHLIREALRKIDIIGCSDGGEFLLILPNVHLDGAMIPLERIRAQIAGQDFGYPGRHITISGGVTECAGDSSAEITERAQELLRQAKEAGRNRLCQDIDIFGGA